MVKDVLVHNDLVRDVVHERLSAPLPQQLDQLRRSLDDLLRCQTFVQSQAPRGVHSPLVEKLSQLPRGGFGVG